MEDYVVNKAGAKLFSDLSKHKVLPIPTFLMPQAGGLVYYVLSVDMHGRTPLASVKEGNEAVSYIVPIELYEWVEDFLLMSKSGNTVLPAEIEFGILNGNPYAKIIKTFKKAFTH